MLGLRHRRPIARRPSAGHPFAAGNYLTDGRRLFRVLSQIAAGEPDSRARLEDCLTLEVGSYAARELYSMRLRIVRAAGR
jgi:hypothetical protein